MTGAFVRAWRIATDTPDYGADDATGEGARRNGGRWNRPGTPMLYTSSSRALAALEVLVHLGKALPLNRYLVEVRIPVAAYRLRKTFEAAANVGWDAEPYGLVSLDWGTDWQRRRESLVAEVPSAVVPEESNLLVNPEHPEMGSIEIVKRRKWTVDPRLGR